jgi:hypothetical protein
VGVSRSQQILGTAFVIWIVGYLLQLAATTSENEVSADAD